jgi:RepB DNA-primase from phage plasmid
VTVAGAAVDVDVVRQVLATRAGERVALSVISGAGAYASSFALPVELDQAVRWVEERASTDQTVSVGVASLSEAGGRRLAESSARARPRAGEHTGYAWVVADLDLKDGQERDTLHAQLGRFPHPPTLLASSGRGLHAWWRLEEMVDVEAGRALCQDLARALSGDPGAADEGRCLRLPGTFNPKERVRCLATLLEHEQHRMYAAATLTASACELSPRPAPPAPRPRRVLVELRPDLDAAEQLRQGHDLADELDRIAGPRRLGKWRCPAGHDNTASLGLHRDDPQRWVCFGGSHPDRVGRTTNGGQYSGDVIDLFALEADQPVDRFLADVHARLRPSRPLLSPAPPDATPPPAAREEVPLPPEPPGDDERPRRRGRGEQLSQADQLVEFATDGYTLGRSRTEPYAVPHAGPKVALALRGGGNSLRQHLAAAYARKIGKTATSSALADALNTLEGFALEKDPTDVELRLARWTSDGVEHLVLDLGDAAGRAVVIGPTGWQVVERSPVVFRRTALTLPLPEPVRGGHLDELRELLNVTDETWPLLVGWQVAAVLPDLPHPIALLTGEYGTGKSSAAKYLVELLDPSAAPLRSSPKDEETWAVSAAASYVVGIDNISTIPSWLSDAMCRAVTGDGMVRRRLYTDNDVSVLALRRVLVLTSIDAGALRGDLADRILTVELERIDPTNRRTDRALNQAWRAAHPRLLGALLDLVCSVMAELPRAAQDLQEHTRMADFDEVLLALDRVNGTSSLEAYRQSGERMARDVAEGDPVAHAVMSLLEGQAFGWRGTATHLLSELRKYAPDPLPRRWPADATRLATYLKRVTPALRTVGVDVEIRRSNKEREISLTKVDELHEQSD